jgi:hypothetical protein
MSLLPYTDTYTLWTFVQGKPGQAGLDASGEPGFVESGMPLGSQLNEEVGSIKDTVMTDRGNPTDH